MTADPPFSTHQINPEVSVEWKYRDDAAYAATRADGRLVVINPPTLEQVAKELGRPLWVKRQAIEEWL